MKVAHVFVEHPIHHLDHSFVYRCEKFAIQRGVRVQVPFGTTVIIGFVSKIEDISLQELQTYPYPIKEIINVIDEEPLMNEELFTLANWMSTAYVSPMISCIQCMLPAKLKPKTSKQRVKAAFYVRYIKDMQHLTWKQQQALEAIKEVHEMPRAYFYQTYKTPGKKLIELGCVAVIEKEASALIDHIEWRDSNYQLTKQQSHVLKAMQDSKHHEVVLLHGVTGSGKTEVFLQLAATVMRKGMQVLLLVPEIALTPQMIDRVKERFGNAAAIYHSALNAQEKYEQYQLVKHHQVQIVVGTRSAVFMPFDSLGLIIMDEEHDLSYKQERMPKYHCRDIAIQRGKYHDAMVLLASATPSLESYARAHKGVYRLLEMKQRVNATFPDITVINMREAMKHKEDAILSNAMLQAIYEGLQRNEQTILLLNRRGYTPLLRCIECGYVKQCPHCDVAMAYHKQEQVLKCHTCGYTMPLPSHCPECGAATWRYLGLGTQKLEELLNVKFPNARIMRMDADTTSKKHAHEQILSAFGRQEADILVGTQMIAKGLDFPNVTLVGIVQGDALLSRNDYRSAELTYTLLQQASGRSGRGVKPGQVIIQAYDTKHYAITAAVQHDYTTFFIKEMNFRHLAGYPPYTFLASVVFMHKQETYVQKAVELAMLSVADNQELKVLGPVSLNKIRDEYRTRILLKGKRQEQLLACVQKMYTQYKQTKVKAKMDIDMEPVLME